MKYPTVMAALGIVFLSACSQNDKPQNTAPADYAETERDLIQNRERDSIMGDSINASTAMPPQQTKKENTNPSGLEN